MYRSTCALVATLCLGSGLASPAQQPASQPAPPFRAGVEGVTLDVSVVDGEGRPVGDLAPDEFIVTVAGRPRRVVSATFVDATATSPAGAPSASPAPARLPLSTNDGAAFGRLVVFVVDQNTLDQGEVRQVASAASRFFDRLTPANRSALVLMPVGSGIPFTADHARVHQALLRASGLVGTAIDLRSLGLEEVRAIAAGDFRALQNVARRECPSEASGHIAGAGLGGTTGGSGGAPPGGQSSGGTTGSGANASGGGRSRPPIPAPAASSSTRSQSGTRHTAPRSRVWPRCAPCCAS